MAGTQGQADAEQPEERTLVAAVATVENMPGYILMSEPRSLK
jgi:hypothetical protein